MTAIAYLDIIGGVSGDMLIAAMLDAGLDHEELNQELTKIVPGSFRLDVTKTTRGAISSTHVNVILEDEADHRVGWREFEDYIDSTHLPETDTAKIRTVFKCLRNAEAQAHGTPAGKSHLHELGTIDTLIDIAGSVIGMRLLGIDVLHASSFPASTGMSSSSHGKNASIAPATMAIIKNTAIPLRVSGYNQPAGESITPTGAAIVATLANFKPANISVETVGYGAGTKDTDTPPNVVGIWLGKSIEESSLGDVAKRVGLAMQHDVFLIEANIDDMTGEELGHTVSALFRVGALDVWSAPIQMKKSRPAVILSAIANQRDMTRVTAEYFKQTSTLGIRVRQLERLIADRELVSVDTEYGPVQVKLRKIDGAVTQIAPEYDDCARIAFQYSVPLRKVMDIAKQVASELLPNQ